MPRVRFTVWRMMVAVAIVAVIIAGYRWKRLMDARSEIYLRQHHVHLANATWDGGGTMAFKAAFDRKLASLIDRRRAHHRAMAAKYERAARYPWLPVAPDPPEPE